MIYLKLNLLKTYIFSYYTNVTMYTEYSICTECVNGKQYA